MAVSATLLAPIASGPAGAQSLSDAAAYSDPKPLPKNQPVATDPSSTGSEPVSGAQSAAEAQSLSGALAGPANRAATEGSWSTTTAIAPPAVPAKDWQSKTVAAKAKIPAPKQVAANQAAHPQPTYALHGPASPGNGHAMKGIASFYGKGARTATGEPFNPRDLTAAHKTLPFGTRVRVTRVDSGESVIVRINDRGPFKPGRVIDLSTKAAEDLRMTGMGLAAVKLEVLDQANAQRAETVAQRSEAR